MPSLPKSRVRGKGQSNGKDKAQALRQRIDTALAPYPCRWVPCACWRAHRYTDERDTRRAHSNETRAKHLENKSQTTLPYSRIRKPRFCYNGTVVEKSS